MILEAAASDAGKRLDSFLHEKLPEYSRSRLQSWIKERRVTIDGSHPRSSFLLHGTETIAIEPGELAPLRAEAEEIPLKILYQDEDVVVVDKPAGIVVHAGAGHARGTLVNALLHHFGTLSSISGDLRPGIVHRLDRETSGVLVVARTDRAHQSLAAQFHDRKVEKIYVALLHGHLDPSQGRVNSPIARDPVRRTRMTTRIPTGRKALTEYAVIDEKQNLSLLRVRIGTGRTHQIRVHLASIGHPIVGDRLYGAPARPAGLPPFSGFLLHAFRLRFASPSTGELITVESPLPSEFASVLQQIGLNAARLV